MTERAGCVTGVGARNAGGAAAATVATRPVIITKRPRAVASVIPIQSNAIPTIP